MQECQEANTSSEFVEWLVFLEEEEWQEHTATHYYLAQIAAEIRAIREGFSEHPKEVTVAECLLKFKPTEGAEEKEEKSAGVEDSTEKKARSFSHWSTMRGLAKDMSQEETPSAARVAQPGKPRSVGLPQHVLDKLSDWQPPKDVKWVETGPELVKDPRWAQVNANAKAQWGKFLGIIPGGLD